MNELNRLADELTAAVQDYTHKPGYGLDDLAVVALKCAARLPQGYARGWLLSWSDFYKEKDPADAYSEIFDFAAGLEAARQLLNDKPND